MANNKGYLARQQAKQAAELKRQRLFSLQWASDAAILAAHDVFQRKGEKLVEFHNTFVKYANEIAEMTLADAKDDKTIDYTKGKIDGQLKELLGDAFEPWEVRYDFFR